MAENWDTDNDGTIMRTYNNIILGSGGVGRSTPREHAAVSRHKLPVVRKMPRTKNVPQRHEEAATLKKQRAADKPAAAPAPAPAPAPHPNAPPLGAGASRPSVVTLKLEQEEEQEAEEEEEKEEEEGPQRERAAPGPARVPESGPRAALAAAPAPAPNHGAPAAGGAGASPGVTLVKEEEAEETLAQHRDRLALALEHGPVRVDCRIIVEDTRSEEDTDGDGQGEEDVIPGGQGGDREGEEGPGGEGPGGLGLISRAAHVPLDDGGRGGAPRRSTFADRAARAKRGRRDVAAADDLPDAPPLKWRPGGARAGQSGRHGVTELTGKSIREDTPSLTWRAQLHLSVNQKLELGLFPTADDAARAHDAEVRRRGLAHVKPLNFPQPEEQAAYPQAGERCVERGLPLSL